MVRKRDGGGMMLYFETRKAVDLDISTLNA